MTKTYCPGFSIIVCYYNAVDRLEPTLRHLSQLKVPDGWSVEIIMVDNNSSDGSTAFAERIWTSQAVTSKADFRVVFEAKPGHMQARRRGLSLARWSHVIYCDDDNWLQPDYLLVLHELIRRFPDVAAFGGLGRAVSSIPLPTFFQWVGVSYGTGPQQATSGYKDGKAPWLYGAGMCIRHAALDEVMTKIPIDISAGRTGKQLSGADDNELCYKLLLFGYRLYYDERLRFDHFMDPRRLSFAYYQKLMAGSARSNALLIGLLMHYKTSYWKAFKRRLHWKNGYIRKHWYRLIIRKLSRSADLLDNEGVFKRYCETYCAWHVLDATQRNRSEILANYKKIGLIMSTIGWETIADD